VRVPKRVDTPCFYASAAVFTALSVYGAAIYFGDAPPGGSFLATGLYAFGVGGSLAGVCYFGKEIDARTREEEGAPRPPHRREKQSG